MTGTVLAVDLDASEAIVVGDDGVRYTFGAADWNEQRPPARGQRVDFVTTRGQRATDVHVDVGMPTAPTGGREAPSATSADATRSTAVEPPSESRAHDRVVVVPVPPPPPKSLWTQWSFLATAGLCLLWITSAVSNPNMGLIQGLIGGITLSLITVGVYLIYRKLRGWPTIPPRHQSGVPAPSPRRIAAIVVAAVVIGAVGLAAGGNAQPITDQPSRDRGGTTDTPASAPNDPTITASEFAAIRTGMTVDQVRAVVGGSGEVLAETDIAGMKGLVLMWEGRGSIGANANVQFQDGRVIGKAQIGLE